MSPKKYIYIVKKKAIKTGKEEVKGYYTSKNLAINALLKYFCIDEIIKDKETGKMSPSKIDRMILEERRRLRQILERDNKIKDEETLYEIVPYLVNNWDW